MSDIRASECERQNKKEKLRDKGSNFRKEYLKLLANEIRVDKKEVRQPGSYNAIAGALHMSTKHEHLEKVPSFDPVWLPSPPLAETADKVVNPPQIFG